MSKSFLLACAHGRIKFCMVSDLAAEGALLILVPGCFGQATADKTAPYMKPTVPIERNAWTIWCRR